MEPASTTVIISPDEMRERFTAILRKEGFSEERAVECANIFTENSIDGVYTHGVNRFPRFVRYIHDGFVKGDAVPSLKYAFGGMEQWDGNLGPGPSNAAHASTSAMRLATKYGIGCVALSNTNHWMRAGNYAWTAAKQGFVFIAWTNTIANMPAWGAADVKLGNNPIVMALPYKDEAIVLDMAMSQYSLGHMDLVAMRGETLPVTAGYDKEGNLTNDPAAILATRRLLPTGYWKGAGLALLLDILSTILSAGLSTNEISKENVEYGLSQVFIAIDISKLPNHSAMGAAISQIIDDYHQSVSMNPAQKITYPGERVLQTRHNNLANGIPVQKKVWDIVMGIYEGTNDLSAIPYT